MIGLDYSWIKLPRTFCDWRWYKDSHMVLLYLHILLHASFSDKEIGEVVIKRGQMLTSYAQLWRTRQTLWRAVQMLTQKLSCQTIHDCPKVVPLHYESEWQ